MNARRLVGLLALLWLAGTGLRLTILAIPPVIPMIRVDLGLSETEVGILSGLPPVLFALAAVPGSLLIARFGAMATLATGLLVSALASGLRGASPDVFVLDATTVLTGLGVSIMQVSLPPIVREWLPHRIAFGTAVYTNGLLVGEVLPVALMIPVVLPLVGGSWRLGMVVWAVPVFLIGLAVLAFSPRSAPAERGAPRPVRRWWPNWKSGTIWRLGLMLGSVNAMYFATNAFIPDHLHALGRADLVSPALTTINLAQIPASLLLLALADRLERRAWPYVVAGILCMAGVVGIAIGSDVAVLAGATVFGFAGAGVLVLILALPPLLSAPEDVPRTTAAMFTISYSCAVIVPILSGLLWDVTHVPSTAFIPITLCGAMLIGFALTIDFHHADAWHVPKAGS